MTGSSPLSHPALLAAVQTALSHELGSPLAAIKGAATTLIDYRQRLPTFASQTFSIRLINKPIN
jgi:K+-sensing histidine kinase KdpD